MTFGIHKWSDLKNFHVESYFRRYKTLKHINELTI